MKTNSQLQQDVMNELKWEPMLNATEIGVAAKDGVITLSGHVDSYAKKTAAEKAAKRVAGVHGIAMEIEVKFPGSFIKLDDEIAKAAINALKWDTAVPDENIKVVVNNGWITLEGIVEWQFQKISAENAVKNLAGVKGVLNSITIKAKIKPSEVKTKILDAFKRNAIVDASRINIEIDGSQVILEGEVRSWSEKDEAENAAWSLPGVNSVLNKLSISESILA